MTLDIRGSLKNTRISKNPLVVVDELLANSIDAFLIRKRDEADAVALEVTLQVKATKTDLLGARSLRQEIQKLFLKRV